MKIIMINGESRSGKSTVAKMLHSKMNTRKILVKNNSEHVMTICKDAFGWKPQREGKSKRARKLFREITHAGYNFDKYFWEKVSYKKVEPFIEMLDYLVVPDWRYRSTYDFWTNMGFEIYTVKVERPNYDNGYDKEVKKDDVGYLADFDFDLYILNVGTIEELEEKVEEGIKMMRW